MNYYIYLIEIGRERYVGSTRNIVKRMTQHKTALKQNKHVNDKLQKAFNAGNKFKFKVLHKGFTLFNEEILRTEQRYINKYGRANESVASKVTKYSKKEFRQDMLDFIVKYWKVISALIITILVAVYGLTTEQATQVIDFIVKTYHTFGG